MKHGHIPFTWLVGFLLILLSLSNLGHAQLPVTYSWLGNTYDENSGTPPAFHVGSSSQGVCAAANNGTIFVNGSYDEGGGGIQEYTAAGAAVMQTNSDEGGFSGQAIACNDNYVYFASEGWPGGSFGSGTMWVGLSRRNRASLTTATTFTGAKLGNAGLGIPPDFLVVDSMPANRPYSHNLTGLVANNSYLYASDPSNNNGVIWAFNANTMATITGWPISCPGCASLALDSNQNLWVLRTANFGNSTQKVVCYNNSGPLQSGAITFAAGVIPTAMAYDSKNNRLLVTDNGANCQIIAYNLPLAGGSPTPVSTTLGTVGGVMSTANGHVPGQLVPIGGNTPYLCAPLGTFVTQFDNVPACAPCLAVDGNGNVTVVECNNGPMHIEQYTSTGTLSWRLSAEAFDPSGIVDPTNENNIYMWDTRCSMDYTRPPAGGNQWSPAALTSNLTTYAADDLRVSYGGASAALAMPVIGGKKFLVLEGGQNDILEFYRFTPATGEIGIPCVIVSSGASINWSPPNAPASTDFIWCDDYGTGQIVSSSYRLGNVSPMYNANASYGECVSVDSHGDIWVGCREKGLLHFTCEGLNSYGVPVYDYNHMQTIQAPPPFYAIAHAFYNPTNDTMYLFGFTKDKSFWGGAILGCSFDGSVAAYYTTWSTSPTLVWQIPLPDNSTDTCSDGTLAYAKEGDIVCPLIYTFGPTGYLGAFTPPPNIGTGWVDGEYSLSCYQRANGEHLVMEEDDGYAKLNLFRIDGKLPPAVMITAPANRTNYTPTANIPISVTAVASAGYAIGSVACYVDGVWQETLTTGPYNFTLPCQAVGPHELTVIAIDSSGLETTSLPVYVVVTNGGLLGYWTFNEGSGNVAHDSSGQQNDITISSGTPTWGAGHFGGALNTAAVSCGTQVRPTPVNAITIAVWAQSSTSTWTGGGFVDQGDSPSNNMSFAMGGIANETGIKFNVNGTTVKAPTNVNIQQWNFYAATYDGGTITLYVNGAQVASQAAALGDMSWSNYAMNIGLAPTLGENTSLNGSLSALRLYNQALSASQINALYTSNSLGGSVAPQYYRVNCGYTGYYAGFTDYWFTLGFTPDDYTPNTGYWKSSYYDNGINTSGPFNTSAPYAAPASVYSTFRDGCGMQSTEAGSYAFPSLTPNGSYTVRLHFCELQFTGSGQRCFNVAINGTQVLTNFDIYTTAGALNTAVVESFTANADANGNMAIVFTAGSIGVHPVPVVSAIEVLPNQNGLVVAPAFNPPAGSYGSAQTVTISSSTSGATIRYSTDGSAPSEWLGTVYAGPVTIRANTKLQAIAYVNGMPISTVTSGTYTIGGGGTNTAITANKTRGTRFQAGSAITISHIMLDIGTSVSGNIQCAIYSDRSSKPGSLLMGTNTLNNPGTGWQTFALTSPQALSSGTYYWLVFWSAANYSVKNTTSSGSSWYRSLTYRSWPSSAGSGKAETRRWSINGF